MNALTVIAQAINAEHAAAHADARSALERARKCGELLLGAKAQTEHGQWQQWIESNLAFGARQAQKYMRLCEAWERLPNANSDSLLPSIDAALAAVAGVSPEREASTNDHACIVIPLGSVGDCFWFDPANERRWMEVHPVLWPDGQTIGMHYAETCSVSELGEFYVDCSRRAPRADIFTVELLAKSSGAPLENFHVRVGSPILWTPPETPDA